MNTKHKAGLIILLALAMGGCTKQPSPGDDLRALITAHAKEQDIKRKVMNNLRNLSYAESQYFLEKGVNTTTLSNLVRDKYVEEPVPVDGEDYSTLTFAADTATKNRPLTITTQSGIVVIYDF
jgi:hypothetical protein